MYENENRITDRETRKRNREIELRKRRANQRPKEPTAREIIDAHTETIEDCEAFGASQIEIAQQIQEESGCSQAPSTIARQLARMRKQVRVTSPGNPTATAPSLPQTAPASQLARSIEAAPPPVSAAVQGAEPQFPSTLDDDYSERDML